LEILNEKFGSAARWEFTFINNSEVSWWTVHCWRRYK